MRKYLSYISTAVHVWRPLCAHRHFRRSIVSSKLLPAPFFFLRRACCWRKYSLAPPYICEISMCCLLQAGKWRAWLNTAIANKRAVAHKYQCVDMSGQPGSMASSALCAARPSWYNYLGSGEQRTSLAPDMYEMARELARNQPMAHAAPLSRRAGTSESASRASLMAGESVDLCRR